LTPELFAFPSPSLTTAAFNDVARSSACGARMAVLPVAALALAAR
jgi:hypothetical protein